MIGKLKFGVLAALLALTLFSSLALAATPEVVVTNKGLALLTGDTKVEPGSPVIVQVVPKGEGPLTPDGKINGYVNETIVQQDGKYKLLFSLKSIYKIGTEYDCHLDLASKEHHVVSITEGSSIKIASRVFDRDTKIISIAGYVWDPDAYGKNLKLTINGYEKTVKSLKDGNFSFELSLADAGITTNDVFKFVVAYTDDATSFSEDTIEIVNAEPILLSIKDNATNADELERILTDSKNLEILGFDSGVLFGDCELLELKGTEFFEKLTKTSVKTDTVSELADSIKTAYTLYNMEANPSDKNLKRCLGIFGLAPDDEITAIYEAFDLDRERTYLFELWKDAELTTVDDACKFYRDAVLRTKLNTAEAWSDLKLFVNDKYTLLGVDEQDSAEFWQKLILEAPFYSVDEFKTKFEQVLTSKDEKPSGGGGSGGGGGGNTSNIEPDSDEAEDDTTTPDVDEPQGAENNTVFKDIAKNHWAAEAITKLNELGIINGKGAGQFVPNDLVTRAEVAKMMCTSANIDKVEVVDGSFSDVDSKHWAIGYIEAAFASELVNGRGNGNFGPEERTTREDMAVFCYRLLKEINPEIAGAVYNRDDLTFADSDEIAGYAVEAVAAMTKLGIINGKGANKFDPKAYCTRAEAAKIFYGVLQ